MHLPAIFAKQPAAPAAAPQKKNAAPPPASDGPKMKAPLTQDVVHFAAKHKK